MRKRKLLIAIALVMLLIICMTCVLAACTPTGGETPDPNPGVDPDPDPDPDEDVPPPPPVKPEKSLSSSEVFNKIVKGANFSNEIVNVDFYVDAKIYDKKTQRYNYYRVTLQGNFISKKENKMAFEVVQLGSNSISGLVNNATLGTANKDLFTSEYPFHQYVNNSYEQLAGVPVEDTIICGFYVYDDQAFLSCGPNTPMLYLQDLDMNYICEIAGVGIGFIDKLKDMEIDLGGSKLSIAALIPIVISAVFPATPKKTSLNGIDTYTMEVDLKGILGMLPGLVGELTSLIPSLPENLDLGAVLGVITGIVPDVRPLIISKFKGDALQHLELQIIDNEVGNSTYNESIVTIGGGLKITDKVNAFPMPEIPTNYEPFSFTNIRFDIDLKANTADPTTGTLKKVDVGKIVNSFTGTQTLPEGLIDLSLDLGIRISVSIDLDLNYANNPVDKNMIAIEIFM